MFLFINIVRLLKASVFGHESAHFKRQVKIKSVKSKGERITLLRLVSKIKAAFFFYFFLSVTFVAEQVPHRLQNNRVTSTLF